MNNFGHVKRVTQQVGGKTYTFRSLLEYRWSVYCELRRQQGLIADWWYEDPGSVLGIERGYHLNIKEYHPDFTILYHNGDFEYEETKGYFPPKDYTTLKLMSEQYENSMTLIFASTPKNSKNSKTRAQIRRAERLEPHIKRIIWNANRDIFQKIKYLLDE
ncbi:hypothetical protein LCGC14_1146170 [marine sediment metagenome]|uniref:Uncharacterized protein n=1 Tax=marine sediment metagenome TaxID=412755 RepID=A0A0F9Q2H5_9ZZZZ